jgi:ATP/maltotriose-dependent transcriptional regulator MalT/two-component SAPR family response regulator
VLPGRTTLSGEELKGSRENELEQGDLHHFMWLYLLPFNGYYCERIFPFSAKVDQICFSTALGGKLLMHPINKFTCPHLPSTVLHREGPVKFLMNALASSSSMEKSSLPHYKLVLLCAPAGYGKTTFLADFANHASFVCCWYFLDESDRDKMIFLQRLISSIRSSFPGFGQGLDALLSNLISTDVQSQTAIQQFVMMIDELVESIKSEINERFALILCHYHKVNEHHGIQVLVDRLLKCLPVQCVVVLESRVVPALDLSPLLARQEVVGIGRSRLCFTAHEVCELAHMLGMNPPESAEAEQLVSDFEGWITGILLGTHLNVMRFLSSSVSSSPGRALAAVHGDRQALLSYIVDEVFKDAREVYTFLKESAVLSQLMPESCNALLAISDAGERLTYIEQQGFFLTSIGDSGSEGERVYACHPVLRSLFYKELERENPQRVMELHRRAMIFFHRNQDDYQAIVHALAAHEYDQAAHFICDIARLMFVQGYSETIACWIDALPEAVLARYPQLLLSRANIYLMQYQSGPALPLLDKASEGIRRGIEVDSSQKMLAEIALAHSYALWFTGDYQQACEICLRLLDTLPVEERELRAMAYQRVGVCSSLLGDCLTGIAQSQQALQLWGDQIEHRQTAQLHGQLANSYNAIGNYALAEHHRLRAIQVWEQLGDMQGKMNSLISAGVTQTHQGAFSQAESYLKEALALARRYNFVRGEGYALVNLGELYQEQDLYPRALAIIEEGLGLARQQQDNYLINFALCMQAMVYVLMEDPHTALLLLTSVDLKTSSITSYEGSLSNLILGTIYLAQERYEEAYEHLSAAEQTARQAKWKRRQVQATIRLAACQVAQGKSTLARQGTEQMIELTRQSEYEHLVQIELRRQPLLEQLVATSPSRNGEVHAHATMNLHSDQVRLVSSSVRCRTLAFGEPTVLIDDTPVTRWRMARAMELYFFLLDCARPVHKEQIIAQLWPDADELIVQTFRSTVHYLRKAVGETCIVHRAGTYRLNLEALYGGEVWYDVAEFQELSVQAKDFLALKEDDAACEALQQMLYLYRGDYVISFYSNWCSQRRDELRRAYMDALMQLARIEWRREQFEGSLSYWQRLLGVDNTLEQAHYGVMCCHVKLGKRTLALRQYQRCLKILQEEFSTTPGTAIQKLYQKLLKSR